MDDGDGEVFWVSLDPCLSNRICSIGEMGKDKDKKGDRRQEKGKSRATKRDGYLVGQDCFKVFL